MYKLILATRYLLRRPITYFAVLAVALCVFIVVVVMTVMTGLVSDFKEKNHDFAGDCVVGSESLVGFAYYEDFVNRLETNDLVAGVSEVIKGFGLLSPRGKDLNRGVEVMGIDPVRGMLIALGVAHLVCLRVQHGVKDLLSGAPNHLLQEAADFALIDSNNLAQWLCAIVHLGGPF